jgi:hypothetical protein
MCNPSQQWPQQWQTRDDRLCWLFDIPRDDDDLSVHHHTLYYSILTRILCTTYTARRFCLSLDIFSKNKYIVNLNGAESHVSYPLSYLLVSSLQLRWKLPFFLSYMFPCFFIFSDKFVPPLHDAIYKDTFEEGRTY